jgi:hypothetical protein
LDCRHSLAVSSGGHGVEQHRAFIRSTSQFTGVRSREKVGGGTGSLPPVLRSAASRSFETAKRIGQYAWLFLVAIIGSFIWLYVDTVHKTSILNRIATLQTLRTEAGKDLVLSVTLSDGSNLKYLVKITQGDRADGAAKEGVSKEKVSSWELEKLGTALSVGDNPMPLGVALKISN